MIILFIILWVLSGWGGFIFWWTREYDFTTSEIPVMLFQSVSGPLAWLFGWSLHSGTSSSVLISRRK